MKIISAITTIVIAGTHCLLGESSGSAPESIQVTPETTKEIPIQTGSKGLSLPRNERGDGHSSELACHPE